MKARFYQAARADLRDAVAYYNRQRAGLGVEFREEVRAAVQRILDQPEAWQPLSDGLRQLRLHRFPYGIVYELMPGEVQILAVAHLQREPEHWRR